MSAHIDVLDRGRDSAGIWAAMAGLSILGHALFFSGVLFLPELRYTRTYIPAAVEVDLVTLPEARLRPHADPDQQSPSRAAELKEAPAKPVKPAEKPQPEKPESAVKAVKAKEKPLQTVEARPEEEPEKPLSMAPRPLQVKKSLKEKTYDASKAIKGAIRKIEEEADRSRPSPVLQAIGKLKEKVEEKDKVEGSAGALSGSVIAGDGVSKKNLDLMDIYNAEIWDRMRKNWAFSKEMAAGRIDWEAVIIVKIMRQGEIRDIWFEKRSGNTYFDDSVFKAVKKSDPLPPLPEGYLGPFYEVGFRFNPSDLQKNY